VNGVRVALTVGGIDLVPEGRFDLVVANILAPVIERLAPALAARLEPSGRLVVSGILSEQADAVASALARAGISIVGRAHVDDWVALRGRL
jgi:ribosomal protein L11 methyltransferase